MAETQITFKRFGANVKRKFPQFRDLSDEDAATQILQASPIYASRISDMPKELPKQSQNLLDPEQIRQQQLYNQEGNPTTRGKIASDWKSAYGYNLFDKKPPTKAEEKAIERRQVLDSDFQKVKGSMENVLQNFLDTNNGTDFKLQKSLLAKTPLLNNFTEEGNYDKQRRGLVTSMAEALGGGTGTGLRINNFEIGNWMNLLPDFVPAAMNKNRVSSLNKQLIAKFGKGLSDTILKDYGVDSSTPSTPPGSPDLGPNSMPNPAPGGGRYKLINP